MTDETRARFSTREIAIGSALALAIGGAVLVLNRGSATLTLPAACPGAAEGIAIVLARLGRSIPLGVWLLRSDRVLAVAAVSVFAILARRSSGTWLVAAAAALAFAAQPALAPRLSVFGPAIVLVAGLVFLALEYGAPVSGLDWRVWLGLLLTAALAPGATLPLAIVAGGHIAASRASSPGRWPAAAIGASALVACVTAFQIALPGRPPAFAVPVSCVLPLWSGVARARAIEELRSMLASAGVFAFSLAALGALSHVGVLRARRAWTALAYAAASVAVAWTGSDPGRLLAPMMVAFWVLVAMGLAESVRACRTGMGGRAAAGGLVVLLPLLQMSPRSIGPGTWAQIGPRGHEGLTLQGVAQVLRVIPAASAFVVEDATLDLMLRALDGTWQRSGKTIAMTPRRTAEVAAVLDYAGTHVFALPAAQAELWRSGFRMAESEFPGVSGVAEVREGGACAIVDGQWGGLPDLTRSSALALGFGGKETAKRGRSSSTSRATSDQSFDRSSGRR